MSKQIEQLKHLIAQMYQFYVDHTVISLAIMGACAFALFVVWDHIKTWRRIEDDFKNYQDPNIRFKKR